MIETEDQVLQFISQPFEAQALQALLSRWKRPRL
jgi:hypothetical protein